MRRRRLNVLFVLCLASTGVAEAARLRKEDALFGCGFESDSWHKEWGLRSKIARAETVTAALDATETGQRGRRSGGRGPHLIGQPLGRGYGSG